MKNFVEDDRAELSVGKIVGTLLVVIVGLALGPTVAGFVADAAANATDMGQTGAAAIVTLITLFWYLGVGIASIMWVVHEAKGA
jgi:hypothetical protein